MPSSKQKFPRYFGKVDFDMEATDTDVTLTSGKFTKVGEHTVLAQQKVAVGIGGTVGGVDTRKKGYIRVDGTASGAQIFGRARITVANNPETDIRVIVEDMLENWDDGVELAEVGLQAGEDSKIAILIDPDSASTDVNGATTLDMSDANNDIRIPVTVYI